MMEPTTAVVPAPVMARQLDLAAAWERVYEKRGMPGVDGFPLSRTARHTEAFLMQLRDRLASGQYRPLPLRLAEIEKKSGAKRRMLLVPAVEDRIAQSAVAAWLSHRFDSGFDDASFAYRPGRGVHDALRALAAWRERGYRWVLDGDIRSFFDSIPQCQLVDSIEARLGKGCPMVSWIREWVNAGVWDGVRVTRLARGVPQGSPLSPLLANLYLDSFDAALRVEGFALVRYADDFVVLCRTPFGVADARTRVQQLLQSLGLALAEEKTRATSFAEGFRFLGARVQGDSILLPFDVKKSATKPSFVASVMPKALLAAWRSGRLEARAEFVWRPHAQTEDSPAQAQPAAMTREGKSLASLRKRPAEAARTAQRSEGEQRL